MFVDFETVQHIWQEVVMVFLAAWIYVGGAFRASRTWWVTFALAAYGVAALVVFRSESQLWREAIPGNGFYVSGPVIVDYLGYVLRITALLVGVIFTLVAARTVRADLASEYVGSLMLLVVGIMLVQQHFESR